MVKKEKKQKQKAQWWLDSWDHPHSGFCQNPLFSDLPPFFSLPECNSSLILKSFLESGGVGNGKFHRWRSV